MSNYSFLPITKKLDLAVEKIGFHWIFASCISLHQRSSIPLFSILIPCRFKSVKWFFNLPQITQAMKLCVMLKQKITCLGYKLISNFEAFLYATYLKDTRQLWNKLNFPKRWKMCSVSGTWTIDISFPAIYGFHTSSHVIYERPNVLEAAAFELKTLQKSTDLFWGDS